MIKIDKKVSILIVFCFLILGFFYSCNEVTWVEYQPHYIERDKRTFGDATLSPEERKNIIHVLKYYGEEYKITQAGKVLITRKLNSDWELVWNYTIKSNDQNWLDSHLP